MNTPTLIVFETCHGWMGVLGSPKGLKQVILPQKFREDVFYCIRGRYNLSINGEVSCPGDLPQRLIDYMSGARIEFCDKLDLQNATDFQLRVWRAVQGIHYGETESYQWVAKTIACLRGEQAIGQALSKNPVPLIVPCHRIIASNGKLGGFSAGLDMKRYLLEMEGFFKISPVQKK